MRPMGNFKYTLRDEQGYFVNNIKSGVKINSNDILGYKGNQLIVIETNGNDLIVKKTGHFIEVV